MAGHAEVAVVYREAAATFAKLVARVEGVADWNGHGLGLWDLRALVGHTSRALTTVLNYLNRPADAERLVRGRVARLGGPCGW